MGPSLIRRVFGVDPLVCTQCAGQLRVVAFITEPRVIFPITSNVLFSGPTDSRSNLTNMNSLVLAHAATVKLPMI